MTKSAVGKIERVENGKPRRMHHERSLRCASKRRKDGADSRNRTVDPIITNDVLYQLS